MTKHLSYVMLLCTALLAGCSSSEATFTNKYGDSDGASGRTSLNGFNALRRTYEQAGFDTRNLYRLTNRAKSSDVVVYIPTGPFPISFEANGWFESWLEMGDRTLVYIVPDSGSEQRYWKDAVALAPPNLRLEYRRRAARSLNERMRWQNNRRSIPHRGWFVVEPQISETRVGDLQGNWAKEIKSSSGDAHSLHLEYAIAESQPTSGQNATAFVQGPTGPNSPGFVVLNEGSTGNAKPELTAMVETKGGDAIVAKVSSKKWPDSKVIVVAGGSLLTNYAFTKDLGRKLADQIVQSSTADANANSKMVSFLTTNTPAIPISEAKTNSPQSTGMELLTVWPLSLVTIHAAILGLVICMVMLPIFGRPKKITETQSSNFGDHLDAMASLLNRNSSEEYARSRISEYMQRMHGETPSRWIVESPTDDEQTRPATSDAETQTTLSKDIPNVRTDSDEAHR